jgi:hypothetical protein
VPSNDLYRQGSAWAAFDAARQNSIVAKSRIQRGRHDLPFHRDPEGSRLTLDSNREG